KGIGGFHLVCDATNEEAVARLRRRKGRWDKPFAVMFKDEVQLQAYAEPCAEEWDALRLAARPVVLVPRRTGVLEGASRGLNRVGALLPYAPLHDLLLDKLHVPVVATSGNLSEEPITIDNGEALTRLSPLADRLLLHNRPIHRRCDDSVVKIINKRTELIRRSRGYVPVPVVLPFKLKRPVLAVGGHQKNTVAIGFDDKIILSQHIGEMDSPESLAFFEEVIDDLCGIYRFTPAVVVHDLHPRYETTRWASASSFQSVGVQHHHAHILSCMAEHGLKGPVLGIAWDGSGYGGDGTLWGGEFLRCDQAGYERLTHFRSLKLIGGERAIREPARVALAILFELFGEQALSMNTLPLSSYTVKERELLWRVWRKDIHASESSSVGRLFDGVASLLGIIQTCSYEAQAPMMVEDRFDPSVEGHYGYRIAENQIDWRPLFEDLIADRRRDAVPSRFINTLVEIALEAAVAAGESRVCLSGGVFQNAPLRGKMEDRLRENGFEVYSHGVVPANDGGLSLGQAFYGGMLSKRTAS
ncbi:MAG: carbamoyltransferase HypF, partial [bacterium]|nr:carbamoyltransferase HypF [bacterium]